MKEALFEENGGTCTQRGDYLLPDVKLPEQPEYEIGVWGQRRRRYLKEQHRVLYYSMMTECTLYSHLAAVEQQTQEMFLRLVEEMAKRQGVTEELKAEDMMKWVGLMNNIRSAAMEVVLNDLIYN